jgi:PEP-CTERM motif
MRKSLWIMLAVLLVAIGAPAALADSVETFDVSASPGDIRGTFSVDVTSGTILSVDITAFDLPDFTILASSGAASGVWELFARDPTLSNLIGLFFTTNPTAGSLVGFTGGFITNDSELIVAGGPPEDIGPGTITPAAVAAPEPSSVALMLLGVGLVFVMRKRIGQRLPQA